MEDVVAAPVKFVRLRWFEADKEEFDADEDVEEEAAAAAVVAEAALRAAIAVGERRPMPDENSNFDIGRAYALGVGSLYACL